MIKMLDYNVPNDVRFIKIPPDMDWNILQEMVE